MIATLRRLWMSLNYRYCMASAYLAQQRGEMVEVGDWLTRADEWDRAIFRDYIQRRFA
jgi:hypothetical protein